MSDHDGVEQVITIAWRAQDIRIIQLMLGHASVQQTQRYLNVTDEELRRGLEVSWNNNGRPLRLASGGGSVPFL
jgi:integrase